MCFVLAVQVDKSIHVFMCAAVPLFFYGCAEQAVAVGPSRILHDGVASEHMTESLLKKDRIEI